MKKTTIIFAAIISLAVIASGCDLNRPDGAVPPQSEENSVQTTAVTSSATAEIRLNGDSAEITGTGASENNGVVTITKAGDYLISGELNDGRIVVEATKNDEVNLILNGVTIHGSDLSAIYSIQSKKTTITLVDGMVNTLSDGDEYDLGEGVEEPNAALFSKDDLTIQGTGRLVVNGNYHHAIATKDNLEITGGSFEITSLKAGIRGNDSLVVSGGDFNIQSQGDAVHSDGDVTLDGMMMNLSSQDDGVHAAGDLIVNGGTINIIECYEGLEGTTVTINGGDISLTASDDGINAAGGSTENEAADTGTEQTAQKDSFRGGGFGGAMGANADNSITINSGNIYVKAGGDGIDSNGSINMTGGTVLIDGPSNGGNSSLDYDISCTVSGGTLVFAGSSQMAQLPGSDSSVNSVAVYFTQQQAANTMFTLTDSENNVIAAFAPQSPYQMISVTSAEIAQGETYFASTGGTVSSAEEQNGYYSGGTLSGAEKLCEITPSGAVTAVSGSGETVSGGGGMGGFGGRGSMGGGMSKPEMPQDGTIPNGERPDRTVPQDGGFPSDGELGEKTQPAA